MAKAIHGAVDKYQIHFGVPILWVCEEPRKYPGKSVYHDDIDDLLAVKDALAVKWAAAYSPSEWKGQVRKDVHRERIVEALHDEEAVACVDDGHDMWDAVGIGLYATRRTEKGAPNPVAPKRV